MAAFLGLQLSTATKEGRHGPEYKPRKASPTIPKLQNVRVNQQDGRAGSGVRCE
jgi:hypothetical protein